MPATYRLDVQPAGSPRFTHVMDGESLVIGRSSAADLVIPDPSLSRQHARLFLEGGKLLVEDLGSRNGTLLNGQPISKPTPVPPGARIQLSGSALVVAPDDSDTSVALGRTLFRSATDLLGRHTTPPPTESGAFGRYAERLRILNEIHQALASSVTLDELLTLILDRVFDHLQPEEGVIFLKRGEGEYVRAASRPANPRGTEGLYSRYLIEEVGEKMQAALVEDILTDARFSASKSMVGAGVRSLLAAPLADPGGSLGLIALNSRAHVRRFTEEDMELLASLASVAALRLRNVALAEEAAIRRRLEAELALARRIQMALLPDRLPEVPGYELYGMNVPSRGVSGDYYEVMPRLDGRECVLMIADVSGKGMAAALLTTTLEALAAGPIEAGLPPKEICCRLSNRLFERTSADRFATAFLGTLDVASGELRYASAGHNPALLVRTSGEIEELAATGLPIGILPGVVYEEATTRLEPGDLLVVYTDGISEAWNPEGEEYGAERIARLCCASREARLADLAAALQKDLDGFVRGVPFADDRTLVMARRVPL